jgi:hypothetical protein
MAQPASRIAALALAVVVVLMAGAPSAAAKKGRPHGHQRKEHRLEERSARKGSRGHHGVQKPKKHRSQGHHRKPAAGKGRPRRPRSHRRDGRRRGGDHERAPVDSPRRLAIGTHDRIDVPEPRARRAAGPARPRRPRPIHTRHPTTIRAAAVETGRALAFPMALSLLALGFVLGHSRIDARDPKLARAPVNEAERLVAFE